MTFQEWKAQMGRGAGQPSSSPAVVDDAPDASGWPASKVPDYATDESDPTGAKLSFTQDPSRYLGHAAKGIAGSPLDLLKGFVGLVAHPIDSVASAVKGVAHTAMHPVESAEYANTHPDEMGSLLGQSLLAPKVPGAANKVLASGPSLVGKGMSAVGRGLEKAGTSKLAQRGGTYGAMGELFTGHPGMAAVTALAPPALEYGGKALQKGGAALEGLDLSLGRKGKGPALVPEGRRLGPKPSVEVPYAGEPDVPGHWERSPSENPLVPSRRNPSIKGLEDASAGDNAWANDKSADPNFNGGEGDPMLAGSTPYPHASAKSPIEDFLASDPQARIGGEGRTTGKFPEGKFGLNNIEANKPYETPGSDGFYNNEFGPDESFRDLGTVDALSGKNVAPSPLDSLAELSAKMGGHGTMTPEEASALFNERFGLKQPVGRR